MADEGRRDQPGSRVPGRPEPARYVAPSQPSSTSRGIHVEITPRNVRLVPGESETAQITVRNLGSVVNEVTLTNGWIDWQTLGGTFNAAPAVTAWGPQRLDVFGRGTNNTLYQLAIDSGFAGLWQQVSEVMVGSSPTAVSFAPGRSDVFVLGYDNAIYHRWYEDGNGWFPQP